MLANDSILYNRYKIVKLLATGGMGAVYEAQDTRLGNTLVAVKETFFADKKMSAAFESEAILLAKLRHPGLPRVMDHFSEGEGQFLVMEFIEGTDLAELLKVHDGKIDPDEIYDWMAQVLSTLNYLHSFDPPIIHRDIKPANIKLTPQGQAILLDFGLAKNQENSSIPGYTMHYAAPEQMTGAGTDARSDLYSLAATIYHLLSGEPPQNTMMRVVALNDKKKDPLKPVSELNTEVPEEVAQVLQKAMALDKAERFNTAFEMYQALAKAVPVAEKQFTEAKVSTQPRAAAVTGKFFAAPTEVQGQKKLNTDPGANKVNLEIKHNTNPGVDKSNTNPKTNPGTTSKANTDPKIDTDSKANTNPNVDLDKNVSKVSETSVSVQASESAKPSSSFGTIAVVLVLILVIAGGVGYKMLSSDKQEPKPDTNQSKTTPTPKETPVQETKAIEFFMETDNGKQLTGAKPFFLGKDQRFRFHFSPRERGYLYIIAPSENDFATMLTKQPIAETGVETNLIEAGQSLTFPAKGWLRTLGTGYYWTVIFSDKPLEKPKFLAAQAGKQLTEAEQKELEEMVEGFFKEYGKEPNVISTGSEDKPSRSVMIADEKIKKGFFIFKLLTE